jgi:hypothetical protein
MQFKDLKWSREETIIIEMSGMSYTFKQCVYRMMDKKAALYNCDGLSLKDSVMYYFDQFNALSFPEKGPTVLITCMFYVYPSVVEENPNIFSLNSVNDLSYGTEWLIVCAIWVSRCGQTHVLTLNQELYMELTEITNINPYRGLVALPKMYVHIPDVQNVVRLFMTHQGMLDYSAISVQLL